jgi:ribosome-binding protein aMBF1 (putative translation factor)
MGKVTIVRDEDGGPAFAVVPWKDYVRIAPEAAEDASLIEQAEAARDEEHYPHDVAKRLVAGAPPLKVFREWRELSQKDLATKARIAKAYVSQVETGRRKLGRLAARKISTVLKVSIDQLLD